MDSEQLFSSASFVLKALEQCELESAVRAVYTAYAVGDRVALEAKVFSYLETASGFNEHQLAVASFAGIESLHSPSYWFDLEAGTQQERSAAYLRCLKVIVEGRRYLNGLAALVENRADPLDFKDDAADIKLRLVDAADRASNPDRIARLIDGVDMIYRACARLAHLPEDGLKVMRIGGASGRTIVFHGAIEAATASRRIIRAANDIATSSIHTDNYSADEVADNNPFMAALDDLYRVGAVNADDAEAIRQGVLAGSIMVLECGARLYGVDEDGDPLEGLVDLSESYAATSLVNAPDDSHDDSYDDRDDELQYLDLQNLHLTPAKTD